VKSNSKGSSTIRVLVQIGQLLAQVGDTTRVIATAKLGVHDEAFVLASVGSQRGKSGINIVCDAISMSSTVVRIAVFVDVEDQVGGGALTEV
jgi:hypothetical protein